MNRLPRTRSRDSRRLAIGAVLGVFLLAAVLADATIGKPAPKTNPSPAVKPSAQTKHKRPNILVIMSDDQTVENQRVMDAVNSRIAAKGATFRDSFVSNPLCCPSRATFLTGQYSQNNGVHDNSPPDGGYAALDNTNTLPVWLQDSGYYTALIGKYLNGYEDTPQPQTIPPGWSNWQATTQTYLYYGYRFNDNGHSVEGGDDPSAYLTDFETEKAVRLIDNLAGKSKPWFTWLTYLAPHDGGPPSGTQPGVDRCQGSAKPAPRDADAFLDAQVPMPPSFNEADVSDKPSFIADQSSFDSGDLDRITRNYQCRLGSLLALDDGVERVMDELKSTGQLKNTYVIYTSDNGWFDGEHRIADGKRRIYEPSIRVPLMIRGPGIKPGTEVKDLVVNADLAPTIIKYAKAAATVRRKIDGRPLQPFLKNPNRQRGRALLLNATRKKGKGVRTRRYFFAHYSTGEYEMYDLKNDPYELQNIYGDPDYAKAQAALQTDYDYLHDCKGSHCQKGPGAKLVIDRGSRAIKQCARRPHGVRATTSFGRIAQVAFKVDSGPTVLDTQAPFGVPVTPAQASRSKLSVDARLDTVDGRRVTLTKRTSICH